MGTCNKSLKCILKHIKIAFSENVFILKWYQTSELDEEGGEFYVCKCLSGLFLSFSKKYFFFSFLLLPQFAMFV